MPRDKREAALNAAARIKNIADGSKKRKRSIDEDSINGQMARSSKIPKREVKLDAAARDALKREFLEGRDFGEFKFKEIKIIVEELLADVDVIQSLPIADKAVIRAQSPDPEEEQPYPCDDNTWPIADGANWEEEFTHIHGKKRARPVHDSASFCGWPAKTNDGQGRIRLVHNPYCLRTHFTSRWGVVKAKESPTAGARGAEVHKWDGEYDWTYLEGAPPGARLRTKRDPDRYQPDQGKPMPLYDLISSPLLLYRMMASFKAPPGTRDIIDPKQCTLPKNRLPLHPAWGYNLWNKDDPSCNLIIREENGKPVVRFRGTSKASNEALQLIEWLVGTNIVHRCDEDLLLGVRPKEIHGANVVQSVRDLKQLALK